MEAVSDGVMTSMPEVSMCTMCDESVSTYYNPVPGMNTILSCVEKKVQTDTGVCFGHFVVTRCFTLISRLCLLFLCFLYWILNDSIITSRFAFRSFELPIVES